jgi:hypothetical protein
MQSLMSTEVKVLDSSDSLQVCRILGTMSYHEIHWRSIRSYLLADCATITQDVVAPEGSAIPSVNTPPLYTVRLSGYLRGKPMHLHSLGHIVGCGTGKVDKVEISLKGGPLDSKASYLSEDNNSSIVELYADKAKQESLVLEAHSDSLTGEQTWPLDSEMDNNTGHVAGGEMFDYDKADGKSRRNLPSKVSLF